MYLWSVCVDPSCQKDFGAKEIYNMGRGRCVNAQAFSFLRSVGRVVIGEFQHAV